MASLSRSPLNFTAEEKLTEFKDWTQSEEELEAPRRPQDVSQLKLDTVEAALIKEEQLEQNHLLIKEEQGPETAQIKEEQEECPKIKEELEDLRISQQESKLSLMMLVHYKETHNHLNVPKSIRMPEEELHGTESSVCKEEEEDVHSDQQLSDQRSSNLDPVKSEPPQIKEEQDELECSFSSRKQEPPTFVGTTNYEESHEMEPKTNGPLLLDAPLPVSREQTDKTVLSKFTSDTIVPELRTQRTQMMCVYKSIKAESYSSDQSGCLCETCGKYFSRRNALIHHMRIHTGENLFSCKICGKSFDQQSHVTRHMKIHTGEKPYCCKICEKGFSQHSHLNRHMRTHTGEKPYCCHICGKNFSNSSNLTVHLRTHTGEKPFACKLCGKSFDRKNLLTVHMRTHTGERPFSCKLCGKSYILNSLLTLHMRTHTGERLFSCKMCEKRFYRSSTLARHMRIHTGEKPFCCKMCGKRFSQSGQITRHMRTHTG